MEVAFSSSTGLYVDQPFTGTEQFSVWHVSAEETCYAYSITIRSGVGDRDGRIGLRADALQHCALVCARSISAPAMAKLASRNIHSLKTGEPVPVEELLNRLQGVLRSNPAPWLRKAEARITW